MKRKIIVVFYNIDPSVVRDQTKSFKKAFEKYETRFAVVDEILLEINPKTLDVAKYPVGLDSRVKDIETLLSSGMEGVIREVSGTTKGLVSLQQQLINDVLKSKNPVNVNNVDSGNELIKARICSKKILVVIDDLDHHKQFEYLVGPFASGSVVIITTRDKDMLERIDVEPIYQHRVNELDDDKSLTLFTQHAFGNAKPNKNFLDLSK
ncbi:hypothetical protein AgCh_039715 [Apium graveolens]